MNKLINALVRDRVVFENGKPQKDGSGSKLLDAFASLGACRDKTDDQILTYWKQAWVESPEGTLRMAFYNRDVRGGQGERRTFRIFWALLNHDIFNGEEIAIDNIPNVPLFGRWDDLWSVPMTEKVWNKVADFVMAALLSGDKLCGKWMPRENKKNHEVAKRFMATWGITPKAYRKLIVSNTEVIESLMCAGQFGKINYSHVPSQASQKYRKAFLRRDEVRYRKYLGDLVKGVKGVKVNAGAIYPHEVLTPVMGACAGLRGGYFGYSSPTREEVALVDAQWKALPNYIEDDETYMVVGDTSGSMGMNGGLPIKVAVSLALYLSERCRSAFKDCFITFSNRPVFQTLKGNSITQRLSSLNTGGWDQNTDLKAVFSLILATALRNKVPAKDMPTAVIIISDMQFNSGVGEGWGRQGAFAIIDEMYRKAGYKRPSLIFWNVHDIAAKPAKFDQNGTALVSGFSPSIMKSIFKGVNPLEVMINTLGSERYDAVVYNLYR